MPDAPFGLRLVAYEPFGERKGVVPGALSWTFTLTRRSAYPVLTVDYAERSVRSSWLEERVEVAVEFKKRNGQWDEEDNCRTLRIERSWDRVGKTKVRRYKLYGLGWLLTRLYIWDQTAQDPGDGPTRPERRFTNPYPGEFMVPTFNAAMARWNMAPGTGEEIWPEVPIEKTYQLDQDSAGAEWTENILGPVTQPISAKLWDPAQLCIDCGIAEFSWKKRKLEAWNFGTYGEDLSQGPAPVIIRDAFGVTSAPESSTDADLAARVKVIGEGGRTFVRENDEADLTYGALELVTTASGITTNEGMNKAARALSKQGESKAEQLTREFTAVGEGFWPLRDFTVGTRVKVQRDNAGGGSRFVPLECEELSLTWRRGKKITGYAKFGDRHEDRLARALRLQARFASGVTPGVGGRPSDPGIDTRYPQAPTGVEVAVTTYLDRAGKTKGRQDISWLPVTLAVAAEDEEAQPINIRGYAIGEKRFGGVFAEITRVGKNVTEWWRDDQRPTPMKLAVAAISAQGFLSAWSEDADGEIPEEDDRDLTVGLVQDGSFRQELKRANRAAAGNGLYFEPDANAVVAKMTSTSHVLKTGVLTGPNDKSGRFRVFTGDRIHVSFKSMRAGFSAASVQAKGYMEYDDGTTDNLGATTVAVGTTYGSYGGVVEVPKPGYMEVRVQPTTVTGTGEVRVQDVQAARQASTDRLEPGSVINDILADLAVETRNIVERAIEGVQIKLNAIVAENIHSDAIETRHLTAEAVTAGKIDVGTLNGVEINGLIINAGELNSADINGGTISGTDLDSVNIDAATVETSFLGAGSADLPLITSDSTTHLGDLTVTGTFTEGSRREIKADLRPIRLKDALRVLELQEFNYRKRGDTSAPRQIGWIAEDADGKVDGIVGRRGEQLEGIAYSRAVVLHNVIIRDQQERIERLEAQVRELLAAKG